MIWQLALTFAAGAAYELGCVFWVMYSEAKQAGRAVPWSMFNALVTAIGVEHFLRGPLFVGAYVVGFGAGTYVAIRLKIRLLRADAARENARIMAQYNALGGGAQLGALKKDG
jgi:hypothetical protein